MDHANLSKYIEKGYNWLLREIQAELEPDALNKKIAEEKQTRYGTRSGWRDEWIEILEVKLKEKYHSVVSRKCCNFVTALYPTIITHRPSIDTFCP